LKLATGGTPPVHGYRIFNAGTQDAAIKALGIGDNDLADAVAGHLT
jgi:hypothetical protein